MQKTNSDLNFGDQVSLFENNDNITQEVEVKCSVRSPLRYPGGKTRGVNIISKFFPKGVDEILSPFFGGGSIELSASAKGARIIGYDIFSPLVEFWQCLISTPLELADEVEKHLPLFKKDFYNLQQAQTHFESKLERAAVFYVLNRSSFSGSTLSGGMSPGHPRFTPSSIQRLREFHNPFIEIEEADFRQSLNNHQNIFTYLDPPYLIKSSLYGKKGDAHKNFDHEGLANILKVRDQWLLSYNDCKEIRDLYSGFYIKELNWKYGMSNDKFSKEIIIFSEDLAETNQLKNKYAKSN